MPRDGVLLLLDRDGTLIEDTGYPNDPAAVRLIPNAATAVRELVGRGFVPAVVSNQSGLARGKISPEQAVAVHERFVELFAAESGVRLPCFYCPHGPDDGCDCRKPRTGLLKHAAESLDMVGRPAVMIGDKPSDVEAGRAFEATAFLLRPDTGWPEILHALGDFA
ncbi:D-glycero-alpha-D-manno-heptose-1,7-bisphosphate 7-phosphatase [Limnoglobus roseus]|uniref:D,D-heptose 1,7-bisphosphate phosphatase n=1 Tax=Limnoglobus roseus TaxID=2598579 RepID=A0A5C1AVY8_9BACT|nr:HAD-IIIA family hydrolase [Limnoglobus roseus]QEL20968.1 HAD family hydrolase [Limnoglobus roseus]